MKILFLSPGWPKGRLWGELGFKFPTLSLASLAAVTPQGWDVAFMTMPSAPQILIPMQT
jgi:hypothetical protein